jgi:hypothetical protein
VDGGAQRLKGQWRVDPEEYQAKDMVAFTACWAKKVISDNPFQLWRFFIPLRDY